MKGFVTKNHLRVVEHFKVHKRAKCRAVRTVECSSGRNKSSEQANGVD